jgi:alpha-L-arabinofuranosidase
MEIKIVRKMRNLFLLLLFSTPCLLGAEPEALIHVHADQTIAHVSPFTTGACIEDVNHEIYGGLYSQMVFGESFQEPRLTPAPPGFAAYGGTWTVQNGEVVAGAGDGPKLVHDKARLGNGSASVEIFFPDNKPGNAGLILKVDRPGVGADIFTGYEIALHADVGELLLGRHRQNWELIKIVPCPVPVNEWITLSVRLKDRSIEVTVNGRVMLEYEDNEHPLSEGRVGLRTWQREARFRNLQVTSSEQTEQIAFTEAAPTVDDVSHHWRAVRRGECQGKIMLDPTGFVGRQSQRISLTSGQGEIGVENRGLNRWGMNIVADRAYEGIVWAKTDQETTLTVAFEDGSGARMLAATQLPVKPGDWQRLEFKLTPKRTDSRGRLTISLKQLGDVLLGHVFLQPGNWGRFKGLPVRRDVSEALIGHGLTVLRYGGSMVNSPEYRWKQMIGSRDRRPPHKGTWYAHSTNGWGIIDFLNFCEAAGFLCIPDLNIDETPQDMADFVEYVNGPADSEWGRRRAADGHPAPFELKYLQLGNEEAVDEVYWQKFKPLVEAIWNRDPSIIPVVGDFAYGKHIADPYNFPGAPRIKSLAAHKKILEFAKSHGKPVWFDVHIWNDNLRDADRQIDVLVELIDWLEKLGEGAEFRVCVFEENANNHLWRRGLAHARTVNRLQRMGEKVPIVCAANCLQPDGQNDNGWDQGLVFLSPSSVWLQPSAYVTRMLSKNNLPRCAAVECQSTNDALDVTARLSDDGSVLGLQVVNSENQPISTRLKITGLDVRGRVVRISQIAGHLDDDNSEADPHRIMPRDREWRPHFDDEGTKYVFPAHSFSVLRFE